MSGVPSFEPFAFGASAVLLSPFGEIVVSSTGAAAIGVQVPVPPLLPLAKCPLAWRSAIGEGVSGVCWVRGAEGVAMMDIKDLPCRCDARTPRPLSAGT